MYETPGRIGPEHLALMFIILACGVLGDLTKKPQDPLGDHFFHLARAAMAAHCTVYMPTVATVQILVRLPVFSRSAHPMLPQFLLSYYTQQSCHSAGTEEAWLSIGAAMKVAQSVGCIINRRQVADLPGCLDCTP